MRELAINRYDLIIKIKMLRQLLVLLVMAALILPEAQQKGSRRKKTKKIEKANNTRYRALFEQEKLSYDCVGMVSEDLAN